MPKTVKEVFEDCQNNMHLNAKYRKIKFQNFNVDITNEFISKKSCVAIEWF